VHLAIGAILDASSDYSNHVIPHFLFRYAE